MDDIAQLFPLEFRTPGTDAGSALGVALEYWVEMSGSVMADNPEHDYEELANPELFFNRILEEAMIDTATKGGTPTCEFWPSLDAKRYPEIDRFTLLEEMVTVVAYAVLAMKAEHEGKHDEAWIYAADARYWAGILRAAWAYTKNRRNPAAELAKRRHAENEDLKKVALEYWRDNIDRSLSASKAANELLKVVYLSHKTLSGLVAKEKKKQS